jgi:hypothetical protein
MFSPDPGSRFFSIPVPKSRTPNKLSEIWVGDPRYDIKKKLGSGSGTRGQKSTGSRTPDPEYRFQPLSRIRNKDLNFFL